MEQALDNLKEITGYLKVIDSAPLMSLTFLKQLDTIRGDELLENKYGCYDNITVLLDKFHRPFSPLLSPDMLSTLLTIIIWNIFGQPIVR